MQSGDFTAVAELELLRDAQASLPKQRLDGQPVVSCGALLEWLLAIEHHTQVDATKQTIRLAHLSWFEQRPGQHLPRVVYRGQSDVALICVDGGLALCAGVAFETALPPDGAPYPPPASLDASEFQRELAEYGLELDSSEVEQLSLRGAGARVRLRPGRESQAGFIVGPRLLDAALHAGLVLAGRWLGVRLAAWSAIDLVCVDTERAPACGFELQLRSRTRDCASLDVILLDGAQREVGRLSGVRFGTPAWHADRCRKQLVPVFRRIIRACVPLAELGDDTPLSALGVTSIDMVRVASHAHDWLGWSPELAEFLRAPTVAGLVDLYRLARPAASGAAESSQALSAIESQLWFLERLTNAAGCYNEGFAWRIRGPIALDALERALQLVQRRHPALRSYFPAEQGKPERRLDWRQCNLELVPTPEDVRASPPAFARLIEDSVRRPFELERQPALRCALFMHGAGEATLVLSVHHMICDAWSLARVLVPELSATYDALLENPEAALPGWIETCTELERRAPSPEYLAEAADHYRRELAGVPHVLDFPFDHPRPAQQTHAGACLVRRLPAARWQAFKALACELEVSPFVLGLSLYQLLLHRYTRQREFCLGVPLSLRRGTAHERVFGCLVNLGVIRAQVDLERGGLREHCQAVRAALIDMLRFDRFSLGEIVRAVAPERSLSHTPLVQAVFGYRELNGPALCFSGCEVTRELVHNGRAKFDLSLAIDDLGDSAELSLEYATDLLEAESAERLLGHFEQLVDDVLRRPGARLSAISMATRAERQLIAAREVGPQRDVPAYTLGLPTLAGYAPDAVVLRGATGNTSAAELRTAVGQLSDALRARGVGPREFVAVCLPRGPAWVIAVLAVLDAGAAYAPFDVAQPRARIAHGVARCRARVLITDGSVYRPDPSAGLSVIDLAAFERFERGTELPRAAPRRRSAAAPAYAVMTSGSTGQPRVAAVAHAGLCNLLAWYADVLQLTAADRVLLATSVGFDLTQKNLFATLLAGAQLVIDESQTLDPQRLCELIEREAVSVLNCTPSLAYALVANAAARDLAQLRSLRMLVLGGEPVDAEALRPWTQHPSCGARIVNSYGPSECSDVVSACDWDGRPDDIGNPIPNARCRVVDVAGVPAALGVPGELWLSGTPLGLGYLADPDAQSSKFVRDHGHWYRTGDLVRRRATGELQFLGRIDTQVKIRGYRIELGEIESALKAVPGVSDALVVCRPDARGRPALAGFVVPSRPAADGGELCATARAALSRSLPSYMLPQTLTTIASLPRTASGKPDRSALPAPRAEAATQSEAPAARLAPLSRIWCEVLGLREFSADADFFRLGGHSLAAVELVSRVESELGCHVRVAALFEHPTLRDFAAHLLEQQRESGLAFPIVSADHLAGGRTACS